MHFSRPNMDTDFYTEYTSPTWISKKPLIFDRSYVSEMVYGDLFRNGTGVTADTKKYIEQHMLEYNYIMVYLKRKKYKWIDREEMYTESDNLKVIEKYDTVFPKVKIPKMRVDSFDKNSIQKILDFYKKHNLSYEQV